jgi:hypothetical protein
MPAALDDIEEGRIWAHQEYRRDAAVLLEGRITSDAGLAARIGSLVRATIATLGDHADLPGAVVECTRRTKFCPRLCALLAAAWADRQENTR